MNSYDPKHWQLDTFEGRPYRVLLPPNYEPARRYPLVVYLHGSMERGDDTRRHLKNGVEAFEGHPLITIAPQCPVGDTFGGLWYGGPSPTQRWVERLVEALATRRSVDEDRLSIVGFSMGAIGGWELVLRRPDLFAAAVLLAGDVEPARAMPLGDTPVWAFHGERDPLVSPANLRALAHRMSERTSGFRYTELPGVGHDVWHPALTDPRLLSWLLTQRRRR